MQAKLLLENPGQNVKQAQVVEFPTDFTIMNPIGNMYKLSTMHCERQEI